MRLFGLAYDQRADWGRTQATLAALDGLTQARAGEILQRALAPATRQMRSFLGDARQHAPTGAAGLTPAERAAWKAKQRYE